MDFQGKRNRRIPYHWLIIIEGTLHINILLPSRTSMCYCALSALRTSLRSNLYCSIRLIISYITITPQSTHPQPYTSTTLHTHNLTHPQPYASTTLHIHNLTHPQPYTPTTLHTHNLTHPQPYTSTTLHTHNLTHPQPYTTLHIHNLTHPQPYTPTTKRVQFPPANCPCSQILTSRLNTVHFGYINIIILQLACCP